MEHPREWPIRCETCGLAGKMSDVSKALGWRLAPNRIGAYVCSPACDQAFIIKQKEAKNVE